MTTETILRTTPSVDESIDDTGHEERWQRGLPHSVSLYQCVRGALNFAQLGGKSGIFVACPPEAVRGIRI